MKITRELLERFSRGECSSAERHAVERWADEGSWPWHAPGEEIPSEIREAIWEKLRRHIGLRSPANPRRRRSIRVLRVLMAATECAALILILVAALFTQRFRSPAAYHELVYATTSQQHKRIILSDSSVVFLSPGSSIRLTQPFQGDKRQITLTGQAIFEATHDPARPFSVISGDLVTTALGTSFKVTSFPGNKDTRVALSYGKVIVQDLKTTGGEDALYLAPGEEAIYDRQTREIHKAAKGEEHFNFRQNILYFKDADLAEVLGKLTEYYQMPIHAEALKGVDWSVSGEFDYQPISTVLQAIAYSCNIHYEIRDHQVYLKPNK